MSDAPDPGAGADRGVRNLRLGVLGGLAVCALVIVASRVEPEPNVAPPVGFTGAAIGLAVASIVTRLWANTPRQSTRLQTPLNMASLALAGAIGLVAVLLTVAEGQWRTGLFYTLAGAMLSIRTTSPLGSGRTPGSGDR